jgi:hypothetical protein
MAERGVEIRIEVDPASDPIRGLVRDRNGETHDFYGWLQFMAAVDRARSAEPQRREPPTTTEPQERE